MGRIALGEGGLVDGPFGSNLPASLYTADGVPVVRGSNLSLGNRRFVDDEFVFVSAETAVRLARSVCVPDDIVFTKKGTLGQTGIVPRRCRHRKFLLSSNQMKLTVNRQLADPLFVYYYVTAPTARAKLIRDAEATGVPKTNVAYLRQFPILLPLLAEQEAIARILGALDDKIELNRKMNETLEQMARAIFKSWFVDFESFRDKGTVESELGRIPKGWRVGRVDEDFNLTMGQSPPGETYNESGEGIPFYQGRTDFGFRFPTVRVFCTAPTRMAKAGDTLVSVRAPVGSVNMASGECAVGRGVAAVRHKSGSRSYTYYFMRSLEPEFARFEAEGTVFGSINKDDFHAIERVAPPSAVVEAFERTLCPFDQRIGSNEAESGTLAAIRDALLPKLMIGELQAQETGRFRQGVGV
ncbi:MAG: restriction endonuclease subunit S [candidate division WOR-3 bacterium]|nr:restriction endonuclease subunit S [candidate division WOR-3 bacterium]